MEKADVNVTCEALIRYLSRGEKSKLPNPTWPRQTTVRDQTTSLSHSEDYADEDDEDMDDDEDCDYEDGAKQPTKKGVKLAVFD